MPCLTEQGDSIYEMGATPVASIRYWGGTKRSRLDVVPGRNARQQRPYFGLAVASMTAERPDGRQLAGLGPARDRLGVDAEHGGHLGRGQKRFDVRQRLACHEFLLEWSDVRSSLPRQD